MVARRLDIRTRSSVRSPGAVRGFSATGGAGFGAGGSTAGAVRRRRQPRGPPPRTACSTSRRITRPASPLPRTADRSTACSSAALRAVGVARGALPGVRCRGGAPAAGAAGCGRSRRLRRAAPAAASSITPSSSPTLTSSPSLRAIRPRTPACGALTSRSILSVSSSTSGSPAATTSPSWRSHLATRASTIDSPTSGTTILAGMGESSDWRFVESRVKTGSWAGTPTTCRQPVSCAAFFASRATAGAARRRGRAVGLLDQRLLIERVPRGRAFGGAGAARPRHAGHGTAFGGIEQRRADEVPDAHVLGLFLHPDDRLGVREPLHGRAQVALRHRVELLDAGRWRRPAGRPAVRRSSDRHRPCRCRTGDGGSPAARFRASASKMTRWKLPSASSRGVDGTSGCRSRLFGVSTTSGSGSTIRSAAWRRSRWKNCAAVVQLATRMLMSAASCRKRSGRALA